MKISQILQKPLNLKALGQLPAENIPRWGKNVGIGNWHSSEKAGVEPQSLTHKRTHLGKRRLRN